MLLAGTFLLAALAASPHGEAGHGGHRGRHGNPGDLDAYVARMEAEDRDAWQKPDEVIRALGLRGGEVVCDIGAGPGYFTLRAARAIGPAGWVHAVDVEPAILAALRDRLDRAKIANVTPVLSAPEAPSLPPGACDVVLVVDTYHHFPDGEAYLRALVPRLRPGGRIVNVDFHARELPVGPPVGHKVSREDFLAAARAAGLVLAGEETFLPYQYFLVLRPAP